VRVQFKIIGHRTVEEIGDDVLNTVRCIAPALVADSDAAKHEYRLFHIHEIGPGVPGLVQVEEMHGEAPGAASWHKAGVQLALSLTIQKGPPWM